MPLSPPSSPTALQAWITSSPPYHLTRTPTQHSPSTVFPDVHDFTTTELACAVNLGIREFHMFKRELQISLYKLKNRQIDPTLTHALDILDRYPLSPKFSPNTRAFPHLILAAKVADDYAFQNFLGEIVLGIRVLKEEVRKIRVLDGDCSVDGDQDDWFSANEVAQPDLNPFPLRWFQLMFSSSTMSLPKHKFTYSRRYISPFE